MRIPPERCTAPLRFFRFTGSDDDCKMGEMFFFFKFCSHIFVTHKSFEMAFDSIDLISANADVPFSNIIKKCKTNFQFKLKNAQCSYFIFQKFEIEKKKN